MQKLIRSIQLQSPFEDLFLSHPAVGLHMMLSNVPFQSPFEDLFLSHAQREAALTGEHTQVPIPFRGFIPFSLDNNGDDNYNGD